MNVSDQLLAVLQEAGLDEETTHLILENKLIAKMLVSTALSVCAGLKEVLDRPAPELSQSGPVQTYIGRKINVREIPTAIAAIRARSQKVTQSAVAQELGCKPNTLISMLGRHRNIRAVYRAALNESR